MTSHLSLMGNYEKQVFGKLCSVNQLNYHKHVRTADIGRHCKFLNKPQISYIRNAIEVKKLVSQYLLLGL